MANLPEGDSETPAGDRGRSTSVVVSIASTAALWLALALLVLFLRRVRASTLFDSSYSIGSGALAGIVVGALVACVQILLLQVWTPWRAFTIATLRDFRLTPAQGLVIATLVAPTEELFFRAALQPMLGLGVASVLFGLAHARFDRGSWARGRRGFGVTVLLMLVGAGAVFGAVFAWVGLAGAVASHFVYDVLVIEAYRRLHRSNFVAAATST